MFYCNVGVLCSGFFLTFKYDTILNEVLSPSLKSVSVEMLISRCFYVIKEQVRIRHQPFDGESNTVRVFESLPKDTRFDSG